MSKMEIMKKCIIIGELIIIVSAMFALLIIVRKDFMVLFECFTALMFNVFISMFFLNKHRNRIEENNVKIAILLPIVFCCLLIWFKAIHI